MVSRLGRPWADKSLGKDFSIAETPDSSRIRVCLQKDNEKLLLLSLSLKGSFYQQIGEG